MVGDTLQTDIVFGNRGMMHTLLVLSGVTTLEECEEALASDDTTRHPTFVLPKVGSILEGVRSLLSSGAAPASGSLQGRSLQYKGSQERLDAPAVGRQATKSPTHTQLGAACTKERKKLMELTASVSESKKEILRLAKLQLDRSASSRSGCTDRIEARRK